jgi:hypothetical protein
MSPTEHDGESQPAGNWLSSLSRRSFLRGGTLAAAAVGVASTVPGLSGLLAGGASEAPAVESAATQTETDLGALSQPLLAHVKDLSTGEISLFQGESEVIVRDPALARRLMSAARP